ncbi:competence type IV pilus minor pilin ComGF [Fictibacillus iocasae]|uniref:Competence type IV pilus minor pilin ComGF n=1 Tax=Fictibacillus iocasae TaxID=2715437 RepID=A0ABW2NM98_9BACL
MRNNKCGNELGMSLIELLIALAMIVTVAACIPLLMNVITTAGKEGKGTAIEETEMFYHDIGTEIRAAKEVSVLQGKLVVKVKTDDTAVFSLYQDKIRKQVNGTGHEIWLQNVSSFKPVMTAGVLSLQITDKNGMKKERSYRMLPSAAP